MDKITTDDVRQAFIRAGGNVLMFQEWLDELTKSIHRQGYREGYRDADYDNVQADNLRY